MDIKEINKTVEQFDGLAMRNDKALAKTVLKVLKFDNHSITVILK